MLISLSLLLLKDAYETSSLITNRDTTSENFNFLQRGIRNIVNFIISSFRIEEAVICASKVAYLSQLLRQKVTNEVHRFSAASDIADLIISHPEYVKLNRLKKTIPEAFFYWYQALALTN